MATFKDGKAVAETKLTVLSPLVRGLPRLEKCLLSYMFSAICCFCYSFDFEVD